MKIEEMKDIQCADKLAGAALHYGADSHCMWPLACRQNQSRHY